VANEHPRHAHIRPAHLAAFRNALGGTSRADCADNNLQVDYKMTVPNHKGMSMIPPPQYWCPVHGNIYYNLLVYGSKPLCPECVKDLLNTHLPTLEAPK
jgi:hypothetical protein